MAVRSTKGRNRAARSTQGSVTLMEIGPVSPVYFHFRFTTSGYIGGIYSIWYSAMPLDVLIELGEINHAVWFDFRQTRRNERKGRTMQVC